MDVRDKRDHLSAVIKQRVTVFTASETLLDSILQRDHPIRATVEHWENTGKAHHRRRICYCSTLNVAVVAAQFISDIRSSIFRGFIEDKPTLTDTIAYRSGGDLSRVRRNPWHGLRSAGLVFA